MLVPWDNHALIVWKYLPQTTNVENIQSVISFFNMKYMYIYMYTHMIYIGRQRDTFGNSLTLCYGAKFQMQILLTEWFKVHYLNIMTLTCVWSLFEIFLYTKLILKINIVRKNGSSVFWVETGKNKIYLSPMTSTFFQRFDPWIWKCTKGTFRCCHRQLGREVSPPPSRVENLKKNLIALG